MGKGTPRRRLVHMHRKFKMFYFVRIRLYLSQFERVLCNLILWDWYYPKKKKKTRVFSLSPFSTSFPLLQILVVDHTQYFT